MLDQSRLLNLIRDLGHNDAPTATIKALDVPARSNANAASTGFVGFEHRCPGLHDHPARRKIGPLNPFKQVRRGRVRSL